MEKHLMIFLLLILVIVLVLFIVQVSILFLVLTPLICLIKHRVLSDPTLLGVTHFLILLLDLSYTTPNANPIAIPTPTSNFRNIHTTSPSSRSTLRRFSYANSMPTPANKEGNK